MKRPSKRTPGVVAASARVEARPARGSWTALLAATTLGVAGASMFHANVQSDASLDGSRSYRLIVQSYDHGDVSSVTGRERPVASVQRAVTAEELKNGVRVGLLEFRQDRREADEDGSGAQAKPVVLAWVEEGKADLELDGLRARPQPGSLLGAASRPSVAGAVQISVRA
jgi:hypothetical protein